MIGSNLLANSCVVFYYKKLLVPSSLPIKIIFAAEIVMKIRACTKMYIAVLLHNSDEFLKKNEISTKKPFSSAYIPSYRFFDESLS